MLETLRPFCETDRQLEVLNAVIEHRSNTKAAVALNLNRRTVDRVIKRILAMASQRGYSPEHNMLHAVPATHYAKGVSTLYDDQGNVRQQWVKSNIKTDSLKEIAEDIADSLGIKPRPKISAPKKTEKDLLTVYPMGDPHIGMYAWHQETGEDFDCEIAEKDLHSAIDRLVETAQPTTEALIVNLGDFFHSDNQEGFTKRSGNALDVDTRKQRVTQIGVSIMVYLIDRVLEKHCNVTVINEVGNHDDESSYMLSLILNAWYRNNPRVTIDLSPATFHYFRFHKVLIGVTHGHNQKHASLGPIMATDRAQDWGETEFRYWLVGHVHHTSKDEYHGCVVETFRTLAAKDAWHAAHGYRAGRDMVRITYHKDYGEVGRETIGIKQIRGAA